MIQFYLKSITWEVIPVPVDRLRYLLCTLRSRRQLNGRMNAALQMADEIRSLIEIDIKMRDRDLDRKKHRQMRTKVLQQQILMLAKQEADLPMSWPTGLLGDPYFASFSWFIRSTQASRQTPDTNANSECTCVGIPKPAADARILRRDRQPWIGYYTVARRFRAHLHLRHALPQ